MGSRMKRVDSYGEEDENPYINSEKGSEEESGEEEIEKDIKQPVWPLP